MSTTVTLKKIVHETDAAILVRTRDERDVWLPLSQVDKIVRGDPPSITVEDWLAEERGL